MTKIHGAITLTTPNGKIVLYGKVGGSVASPGTSILTSRGYINLGTAYQLAYHDDEATMAAYRPVYDAAGKMRFLSRDEIAGLEWDQMREAERAVEEADRLLERARWAAGEGARWWRGADAQ